MSEEKSLKLAREIVAVLDEKKGEDILLLDLIGICSFADYFILTTAPSKRTIRALRDDVQLGLKQSRQLLAGSVEGEPESGWVLLDYGDVIVHIFSQEMRDFYRLEDLWGDGRILLHVQ
jgi:ribosome-associated protein